MSPISVNGNLISPGVRPKPYSHLQLLSFSLNPQQSLCNAVGSGFRYRILSKCICHHSHTSLSGPSIIVLGVSNSSIPYIHAEGFSPMDARPQHSLLTHCYGCLSFVVRAKATGWSSKSHLTDLTYLEPHPLPSPLTTLSSWTDRLTLPEIHQTQSCLSTFALDIPLYLKCFSPAKGLLLHILVQTSSGKAFFFFLTNLFKSPASPTSYSVYLHI